MGLVWSLGFEFEVIGFRVYLWGFGVKMFLGFEGAELRFQGLGVAGSQGSGPSDVGL